MSKILDDKNENWFKQISPTSYIDEKTLEQIIEVYLDKYLVNHSVIPCSMYIRNSVTKKRNKPDLAIISHDYSEWYVVEVELSSHRFKHIMQQIDTFCLGEYNQSHADYMFNQKNDVLNRDLVRRMVREIPPRVMVIINDSVSSWMDELSSFNVDVGIFQIYYDQFQHRAYRFKGHFPALRQSFATCLLQPGLPTMVQILESDFFDGIGIKVNEEIGVIYNGRTTKWKRIRSRNIDLLHCLDDSIPLDPISRRYFLVFDQHQNEFEFNKA